MAWYELIVKSNKDICEELTTLLLINGIEDLLIEDSNLISELDNMASSWDYVDENSVKLNDDYITYKSHYESDEKNYQLIFENVKSSLKSLEGYLTSDVYEIDPNEGVDNWKEYFKPFEICKGIVICPSWEKYEKKSDEDVLVMDTGSAFGTGTHETTKLCAEFINLYMKKDFKVLDIGSGSGILSIISVLRGAKSVKAIDIDEFAIKASKDNAIKNGFQDKIVVSSAEEDYGENYDIIISNLTSPILIDLSERIKKACKQNTLLIFSGILTEGKEKVINCYKKLGFDIIEDKAMGEWTALLIKNK